MANLLGLLEASTGSFDATQALSMAKDVMVWILDVIKSEPILACVFVIGVLVPSGFGIVRAIKNVSRG